MMLAILALGIAMGQELAPKPAPAPGVARKMPLPKVYNMSAPAANETNPKTADPRLVQAGFHRPVKPDAMKNGKWEKSVPGLWRFALRSPGAAGIRVHFKDVNLDAGKLWVHGKDGPAFGPYSGKGPLGDGEFWSDVVSGDTVVVELQASAKLGSLPFRIVEVSHLKE